VLDILVTEVCLQRPRVVAAIGKGVAAGVTQHMGMRLDRKFGPGGGSIDHLAKPAVVNGVPRSDVNTKGDFGS
jgi:hypothetical protein